MNVLESLSMSGAILFLSAHMQAGLRSGRTNYFLLRHITELDYFPVEPKLTVDPVCSACLDQELRCWVNRLKFKEDLMSFESVFLS